jgi:hypothetical protein
LDDRVTPEKISPIRHVDLLEAQANLCHFLVLIESGAIPELIIVPKEDRRLASCLFWLLPRPLADNERIAKLFGSGIESLDQKPITSIAAENPVNRHAPIQQADEPTKRLRFPLRPAHATPLP